MAYNSSFFMYICRRKYRKPKLLQNEKIYSN